MNIELFLNSFRLLLVIHSAVSASDNSELFPHFLELWKRVKQVRLLRGQYIIIDLRGIALTIMNACIFQIWSTTAVNEDLGRDIRPLRKYFKRIMMEIFEEALHQIRNLIKECRGLFYIFTVFDAAFFKSYSSSG